MLTIVKIGGNVIDDPRLLHRFLVDWAAVTGPKLLVHGGGKIASAIGQRLGIEPKLVDGRRITDAETLEVVTMVYGGLVNKNIVAQLQALGSNAIGLTGADANIIKAKKRPVKTVDYGFVGDVSGPDSINVAALDAMLQAGFTPVVAPLTHDGNGSLLNTNADTVASVLAVALAEKYKVQLLYCFEKKGVLRDAADEDSVVAKLTSESYSLMKEAGQVYAGMLPKLDNAFATLRSGVSIVKIGQSEDVLAMAEGKPAGTTIALEA
ncbi:acetylglutamate kinase [Pontibacter sp. BT310]|uniref:Acetylglutamate kinase n=1 Tax=Pontibacter populi TaxID=890055 RepID=A0ABS6X9Z8_9BACT|nr:MULTISPECIES: acetylglutamate kinase [Pontibacter]MBJ6117874.1 acetylglutamate kinase [Pontibacter sp. BT310]MBR0570301.1 acetylglutamate kinase [Microvirga sp. STS03]MBW3364727.1 acetylglutamate kinase [Pontibacter populi]